MSVDFTPSDIAHDLRELSPAECAERGIRHSSMDDHSTAIVSEEEYLYHPRFYQGGAFRVEITSEALRQIVVSYEQSAAAKLERCGILVGHYSDDCTTAIVDELAHVFIGEPMSVCMTDDYARTVSGYLHELWDKETGRYYVGDWHSHPNAANTASGVDITTSMGRAADPAACCPQLIMTISGNNGLGITIVEANSTTILLPDSCVAQMLRKTTKTC